MTISDRIFEILQRKGMSQKEFSELTNIGQSTISDWKHKNTTPAADKILPICQVLGITPEELLSGTEYYSRKDREKDYYIVSKDSETGQLLREYGSLSHDQRQRLAGYLHALSEYRKQNRQQEQRQEQPQDSVTD